MFCPTATHDVNPAAEAIFRQMLDKNFRVVDRAFAVLLLVQWCGCVLFALLTTPLSWVGTIANFNPNVWFALLVGGLIISLPVALCLTAPGKMSTRWAVASSQVLISSLLIYLNGGRIEAHFHVFVSLALLIAYRDRSVFIPAVMITALDHIIRGFWWPESVYGTNVFTSLRPIEHTVWLLVEVGGLSIIIRENLRQLMVNADLQCKLQSERDLLEMRVLQRTKELHEAEAFKATILNSLDAHICILDHSGTIVFANEKWQTYCNSRNDWTECDIGDNYILGCEQSSGSQQKNGQQIADSIRSIIEGATDNFVAEYECRENQQVRHYQLLLSPVPNNGLRGVAVIHIDVTAMKVAENRAHDLAKLILESPDEVLIACADTLKFIEANNGACCNSRYTRDELLTLCIDHFLILNDRVCLAEKLKQYNVQLLRVEAFATRKDGSRYPCRVSLHRSTFGNRDVWVAFISDLSDQKRLENKLNQAQKLESLGHLAAGLAHEINTPMQCVFGNVEFVQKSFVKLTTLSDRLVELLETSSIEWEKERAMFQSMRNSFRYDFLREQTPSAIDEASEAARRVISIVRAMKSMSHPGTADAVPTDLHDLIRNASIITRHQWKYTATVKFDFRENLPMIDAFPSELSQVFMNLFVNSTDAIMEKLGPEPVVFGEIRVHTSHDDQFVYIRFHDTGAGIPQSIRKQIYDPFFTTKAVGKGTGQGLALAQHVITVKHGGTIGVESEPGLYTTFIIKLPIKHAKPTTEEPPLLPVFQTEYSISNSQVAL